MEGIYARCILNQWDGREHRGRDLYLRTKELVQTRVLPGVYSPRSLYEEREGAIRLAYNYFVKYCWYDYAVEIGEWMKNKNEMDTELFRREPLYMSMVRIRDETKGLRYKKEEKRLRDYYLDIADHTPNMELKTEMLALSNDPLQEVTPRLKNNPHPPVLEILLENANKQVSKILQKTNQINLKQN